MRRIAAFLLVATCASAASAQQVVVSTASHAVLGSVTIENEDLARCVLGSTGFESTSCTWSLFFDGSAAGLNSAVRALDLLPDGSLILEATLDGSIPDLSAI